MMFISLPPLNGLLFVFTQEGCKTEAIHGVPDIFVRGDDTAAEGLTKNGKDSQKPLSS